MYKRYMLKRDKMAKSKSKAGKISIDGLRSLINKTSGVECAHNLNQANQPKWSGFQLVHAGLIPLSAEDS